MESNQPFVNNAPASGNIITEKMYGIATLWLFKGSIIIIIISIIALFFDRWFPQLLIILPFYPIVNFFIRSNFHYSIEEKILKINQGVISKKDFMLPYGVIQNVVVKQDFFDRIFSLGTLNIQNAVGGNNMTAEASEVLSRQYGLQNLLGASKNGVSFVGLKIADANILKNIILRKMEENKIDDRASGL